jgi:hypothetical protein
MKNFDSMLLRIAAGLGHAQALSNNYSISFRGGVLVATRVPQVVVNQ